MAKKVINSKFAKTVAKTGFDFALQPEGRQMNMTMMDMGLASVPLAVLLSVLTSLLLSDKLHDNHKHSHHKHDDKKKSSDEKVTFINFPPMHNKHYMDWYRRK